MILVIWFNTTLNNFFSTKFQISKADFSFLRKNPRLINFILIYMSFYLSLRNIHQIAFYLNINLFIARTKKRTCSETRTRFSTGLQKGAEWGQWVSTGERSERAWEYPAFGLETKKIKKHGRGPAPKHRSTSKTRGKVLLSKEYSVALLYFSFDV